MKSIAAVFANQTDAVLAAVTARYTELREAERAVEKLTAKLEAATSTSGLRRVELGRALLAARKLWPESGRGPRDLTWEAYLDGENISRTTAWRYMQLAEAADQPDRSADAPVPTYKDIGIDPNVDAAEAGAANVNGGSGETARGAWCTPKKWAERVGEWDLDPFSNPRSHIVSKASCQLERRDNGLFVPQTPGSYWVAPGADATSEHDAVIAAVEAMERGELEMSIARSSTRVFIQPPYDIVLEAIAHYGHTRFCALLRFDPSTDWFAALWALTDVVAIPFGERLDFEPPPGIDSSSNPYPHAFFYASERDVTDEIRKHCIVLRVERSRPAQVD